MQRLRTAAVSEAALLLERRIAGLETLPLDDLRREWGRVVKTAPHLRLSADLLRRGIAHRLQEAIGGKCAPHIVRKLASIAGASEERAHSQVTLKVGTTLVREWHGRTHTVRVLDGGFEFNGRSFDSLTAIAKDITGAAWSGPRFFGVQNAGTAFRSRPEP